MGLVEIYWLCQWCLRCRGSATMRQATRVQVLPWLTHSIHRRNFNWPCLLEQRYDNGNPGKRRLQGRQHLGSVHREPWTLMCLTPLRLVAFRRKLISVDQPLDSMNSSWPMHWVSCFLMGSPHQTQKFHVSPTLMPILVWYPSLHPIVLLECLS